MAIGERKPRRGGGGRLIRVAALICTAIVGGAGIWAIASGELTARLAAREARGAIADQHWAEAEAALKRWRSVRPDSAEASFLAARVAFEQERFDEVSPLVDRAQWLGYPERPLYRLRALLFVRLRRFMEAEPILLNLLDESSAPDPEADAALARVFLETYRLESAAKVLQRWIRDDPRDARPYLWWTEIDRRLEVDNPHAMERHYRTALELDPHLDAARLGLADTLRDLHRWDAAASEYRHYLERQPSDPAGYLGLAQVALEQGEESEARKHLAQARTLDPENLVGDRLQAGIDIRRGDDEAALGRLDRVVRADPLDLDALYKRCLVLSRLGRKDEAEADQRRLEQLRKEQLQVVRIRDRLIADPSNNAIRLEMAQWMLDHGRNDQAIRWLQSILSAEPRNPQALELLVQYHERRGERGLANYYRMQAAARP